MTVLQKPLNVYMMCSLYASVQGINDSPFLTHGTVHDLQFFHYRPHSLQLEKCKKDKILIGQKYKHQNSNIAIPIHVGLSVLNTPSIGIVKQEIKNNPCTMSKYFSHLSIFDCGFIVNPAKNVANDITP